MRREIFFIFSVILFIPATIAQGEIEFFKEIYSKGETIAIRVIIEKNILQEIQNTQIHIRDQQNNIIFVPITLLTINKTHYLSFFHLPTKLEPGQYSVTIEDLLYRENNLVKNKHCKNILYWNKRKKKDIHNSGSIHIFSGRSYLQSNSNSKSSRRKFNSHITIY